VHAYLFKGSPRVRLRVNPIFRPRNERGQVQFVSTNNADLPEPGLIALHRACAKILGLSGAGEYIEKLLRDDEKFRLGSCVQEELGRGEVDLPRMISLRLAPQVPIKPIFRGLLTRSYVPSKISTDGEIGKQMESALLSPQDDCW
jgi:hypothetical protein